MSKSTKKTKALSAEQKDARAMQSAIDTASGTVTIGGKTYQVKGHAVLPVFQVKVDTPQVFMFDAEMVTKPKVNKQGPVLDDQGNPATITIAKVVRVETGEVGQIVCGAILARALKEYPGGYVGKTFALTKHDAPSGKAKPWTVTEVSL